jgi:hypothetical protein
MFTNRYEFALPLRRLLCVLTTVVLASVGVLVGASPASADTSQFRGMNWARTGDNFTTGTLVLDGLSGSDSYATVRAKAAPAAPTGSDTRGVTTEALVDRSPLSRTGTPASASTW